MKKDMAPIKLIIILLTKLATIFGKTKIYVGVLIPRLYNDQYCFASAMNIAVGHINDDPAILRYHEIILSKKDTLVSYYFF